MTKLINGAIAGFALISMALGTMAYLAPRPGHDASVVSMIAGVVMGLLLLASLFVWKKVSPRGGRIFSAILCVLALGQFIPKWLTKGFYPNGLLALIAGVVFVLLVAGHVVGRAKPQE